jgi:hypothetical protein
MGVMCKFKFSLPATRVTRAIGWTLEWLELPLVICVDSNPQ